MSFKSKKCISCLQTKYYCIYQNNFFLKLCAWLNWNEPSFCFDCEAYPGLCLTGQHVKTWGFSVQPQSGFCRLIHCLRMVSEQDNIRDRRSYWQIRNWIILQYINSQDFWWYTWGHSLSLGYPQPLPDLTALVASCFPHQSLRGYNICIEESPCWITQVSKAWSESGQGFGLKCITELKRLVS